MDGEPEMKALIIRLRNAIAQGYAEEAELLRSLNEDQRHLLNIYKMQHDL